MQTAEIRRRFLEHFAQRDHTVVPSASLISPDPSLLFTVAGMVPFIPYLTGREPAPFPRATSVQKCVRTLDIEEVGKTTRHGTFFQMNGNFSFGDYFKEGAIQYAWELITGKIEDGGLGFDPDTIWATVYLDDDEGADAWHRIAGLPKERIQRLGKKDNYWHTGAPGPGGPCSEIYVDRGAQFGPDGGPAVDLAGDRFLEIWNLVFMQYELDEVRSKEEFRVLGELPKKNIDTGMGLERVAYLLQGVENMYEIDEVSPVLRRAAELAGVTYGRDHESDVRLRVVADHVRSGLMLIGDGVTPGNEGGGYILRRLLRRAVRSMKLLGIDEATLPELLPVSRDAMSASYPELATDFDRISAVAYAEEEAFRRTLSAGTTLFDTAVTQAKAAGTPALSGDQAFSLHDTYGFPIDVTLEMAAEQGVTVDEEGFRALMKEQRERARADARAKRTGSVDVLAYRRLLAEHGPTDWQAYDTLRTDSRVLAVVAEEEGAPVAGPGEIVRVVLDRTPFYAESGGQVADAGVLTWDGGRAEVIDVQRPVKGLVAHQVRVLEGELRDGVELTAEVDYEWRLSACQAHSGTHVVHAALRQVLGPQALQSGSYNRPGYLRLDFAWQGALSPAQRTDIEDVANAAVRADHRVTASYMTLPEAQAFGAIALFGETYGEQVRVVEIGGPWSRELCGGTHVRGSAQIGTLALTGESSVGSGARRVEAVVGLEGFRYLARERDLVRQLAELLKSPQDGLVERVSGMVARLRDADKELADLRSQQSVAAAGQLAAAATDVGGVSLVTGSPAGLGGGDLRTLALDIRGRLPGDRPSVVLLASESGGKVALVAALNPAALERGLSANDVLRAAAAPVGGRGGGKADVAQGGGTDPAGIPAALQAGEQAVVTATGR
ncbi:alanine--tRNA ligase [Blastococcus haudaquaticus]|uniref:Alanine--tRNA ligase n=1 Tax=Blastococcus haudaquaticus TaxID=1938745 RepID=A0A286H696_9ACTN|nr:alanine--tRNA ligase [Blastococcus haudaquaticus]SOE03222.1 alanyl-tRNA synthetase [Blastococcus haudaquaticus]